MLIKVGVDISRLKAPIRKTLSMIEMLVESVTRQELVITSTYEGDHIASSLHYANLAVDIRTTHKQAQLTESLQEKLGKDYDIILESDHIHIEYDPSKNTC